MTGQQALTRAITELLNAGVQDAPRDARRLLAHAMDVGPDRLTPILHDTLDPATHARFLSLIAARTARQPVSQITGYRDFYGRRFRVTRDVLDPRPDTEALIDRALQRPVDRVLDLGTGSGAILLSILGVATRATGIGADISPEALEVARQNARDLGVADRAEFVQSNWCAHITGTFDLIVSNPPYIGADELPDLAPEVRDWEPLQALSPGQDALAAYCRLAEQMPALMTSGGRVLLEIGATQGAAVADLLTAAGFSGVCVLPDLDGRDRVVEGVWP